ncbi:unnamed protein product [Linum tenue]|uniref:CAAX prenyl protease 2/Lysostaphin resistance protein A-like domain-containing protein n=1 Tax=Linum tenue TaxID=586396 RepID=A0AAV0S5W9_9ROSI|nr:unnamed protein product [Linum tenue]
MSLTVGLNCCRVRALGYSSALLPWRPSICLITMPKGCRFRTRASGRRRVLKKKQREEEEAKSEAAISLQTSADERFSVDENPADSNVGIVNPPRGAVIQACTLTSGLIAALGILLRQVSHVAAEEGLPVLDCSEQVSFGFEIWHLGLIFGLVLVISSSRFLLLKTWPDFRESSEAANQQVLTSLEPLDYLLVAFLPGVSEVSGGTQLHTTDRSNNFLLMEFGNLPLSLQELLFRGALQPLFGMDLKSVLAVAALFGILHLGNGRKYSFAFWATFVGCIYGYATIASSSIVVPMAAHALNNLIGGISWRYSSQSFKALK